MPVMLDSNRATAILNAIMAGSAAPAWPAGWSLRLMYAMGSNTTDGTELSQAPSYGGYTAGGQPMAAWAAISGTTADILGPPAAVAWTATSNWSPVAGVEIWDDAATPLRWFDGALSGGAVTVNNGTRSSSPPRRSA
jgi:hypothetical protein